MQELIGFGVFIIAAILLAVFAVWVEFLFQRKRGKGCEETEHKESAARILDRLIKYDARFLIYAIYFVLLIAFVPLIIPYVTLYEKADTTDFAVLWLLFAVLFTIILYAARKNMLKWR